MASDDPRQLPAAFLHQLEALEEAYLRAGDPIEQSGFHGGPERWRAERGPILDALTGDGDFLDAGCANGYLLECLVAWAGERGVVLTPWGLDQGARLIELARARLPACADNFFVGNSWDWDPPRKFRYVYTLLDAVPVEYESAHLRRLFERALAPGGRLIAGDYGSRSRGIPPRDVAAVMETAGLRVAGVACRRRPAVTRFAWAVRGARSRASDSGFARGDGILGGTVPRPDPTESEVFDELLHPAMRSLRLRQPSGRSGTRAARCRRRRVWRSTTGLLDAEFAPDGIVTSSLGASSERAVRESHFDHTLQDSFREGGNIPPIWARSRGADTRLIGATWVEQYQAIVALPETGLRSAADLRGRRLGIVVHINDQVDFHRALSLRGMLSGLASAGLNAEDVEIVYLTEEETYLGDERDAATSRTGTLWSAKNQQRFLRRGAFALIRREVDAIFLTAARGLALETLLGAERVVDLAVLPGREERISNSLPIVLTASGALVRKRPDLVRRYLDCVRRAARWAAERHAETRRIIAAELGDAEEWLELSYGPALSTSLEPSLSDDLLSAVDSQKAFLLAHGFIDNDFDVREWAAPELY